MYKTILVLILCVEVLLSCTEKKKTKFVEKTVFTKNTDSYGTDTFYAALPDQLVNLSESHNMVELLAQNWIMEDDLESLRYAEDGGEIEMPIRSLSMSDDHTIIKNCRNAMLNGTWIFNENGKTLTFTYTDGSSDLYKLRALAADEMQLTNIGIKSETILKFVSSARKHKRPEEDPFHIKNNLWRIKPAIVESDEAIRERLKQNINFFILFYKDVIAHKADIVSFYGFPSCLNWYSGGIYLKKEEELPEKWVYCFYNKKAAKKAYEWMGQALSKKYNWPSGDPNWIKKNLFVLEQVYRNL